MSAPGQNDIKIKDLGDKSKKAVDLIFILALFLFVACYAMKLTKPVVQTYLIINFAELISTVILLIIAFYRLFFAFVKDKKSVLMPLLALAFGTVINLAANNNAVLTAAVLMVAGMGVSADRILAAGICGNIVMILNNLTAYLCSEHVIDAETCQQRQYILLGENTFLVPRMNNYSSTDFAAHYFWMIAPYLWIRGKKITWGEIFALGGLNLLVYALTAAKTTLLCITLLIFCAVVMKIWPLIFKGTKDKESALKNGISKVFTYCCRFAYVIFAAVCIPLAALYTNSSPFFLKLNDKLHWRLSLGKRGIVEYGIHWIASGVKANGYALTDDFYNFYDCSYLNMLITGGILIFVFYMICVTAVQFKNGKYLYGAALLTVCAVSCIEEHHLAEISYNLFILLLFADLETERKLKEDTASKKKSLRTVINTCAMLACAGFIAAFGMLYYPKYKAVKELDRLDSKAGMIYGAVQRNLDGMVVDGKWGTKTSSMNSNQYGETLAKPADFSSVNGISWNEATKDPKEHSYYSFYYSAQDTGNEAMSELLINDEVKGLIGNGSAVIEYDVIKGKVYSVWFSETPGCSVISNGRRADRIGRLRADVKNVEGYSTGKV